MATIREYRDIKPGEMSVVTTLATKTVTNDYGRKITWDLRHHTAGWECAGSCARWTDERWSITTFDRSSNTSYGQARRTLAESQADFDAKKDYVAPEGGAK